MKKIVILFLTVFVLYGCEKDKNEINGVVVDLISVDDTSIFKKSVVLFDDNYYHIKTPLDTFILGYPFKFLYGYDDMKSKAINDAVTKDILIVSDYMKNQSDSVFTLAYYLELGNCHIFDKKFNRSIKTIVVETYHTGEPMASTGGRRFYIKNKLFLETVDWISK